MAEGGELRSDIKEIARTAREKGTHEVKSRSRKWLLRGPHQQGTIETNGLPTMHHTMQHSMRQKDDVCC